MLKIALKFNFALPRDLFITPHFCVRMYIARKYCISLGLMDSEILLSFLIIPGCYGRVGNGWKSQFAIRKFAIRTWKARLACFDKCVRLWSCPRCTECDVKGSSPRWGRAEFPTFDLHF